jgi:hypothetical protein
MMNGWMHLRWENVMNGVVNFKRLKGENLANKDPASQDAIAPPVGANANAKGLSLPRIFGSLHGNWTQWPNCQGSIWTRGSPILVKSRRFHFGHLNGGICGNMYNMEIGYFKHIEIEGTTGPFKLDYTDYIFSLEAENQLFF